MSCRVRPDNIPSISTHERRALPPLQSKNARYTRARPVSNPRHARSPLRKPADALSSVTKRSQWCVYIGYAVRPGFLLVSGMPSISHGRLVSGFSAREKKYRMCAAPLYRRSARSLACFFDRTICPGAERMCGDGWEGFHGAGSKFKLGFCECNSVENASFQLQISAYASLFILIRNFSRDERIAE